MIRRGIRRIFRLDVPRIDHAAADVAEEIALHIQARRDHLISQGMSPGDASRAAEQQFGGARNELVSAALVRDRRLRWSDLIDGIAADWRAAWRTTARSPRTSLMVVLLLALGAGANGALSGLVYRMVVRGPAGVTAPSELVRFFQTTNAGTTGDRTSDNMPSGLYDALRGHLHSAVSLAMYYDGPITIGTPTDPRRATANHVTASYFGVLGARPFLGRTFLPEDDRDGAPLVAVLGWNFWQREFGGDTTLVGRQVPIGRRSYQIIGIMPRGFNGVGFGLVDLWLPFGNIQPAANAHSWISSGPRIIARRAAGVAVAAIGAEAAAVYQAAYLGYPSGHASRIFAAPISANSQGTEPVETAMLRWLVLVAAIVLLVACANAANLLLARAAHRRGEMAVRMALGAGRWRIVRLVLVEGMLLAVCAAIAAFGLAEVGAAGLRQLFRDVDPAAESTAVALFGFTFLVALLGGIGVSIAAALQALDPDIATELKTSQRSVAGAHSRVVPLLTMAQVALSTVLVIAAGLFVRSARQIATIDVGVDATHLLQVDVALPDLPDGTPDSLIIQAALARYAAVTAAVRALPGVTNATIAVGTPLGSTMWLGLRVAGKDSIPQTPGGGPNVSMVASDYFATIGTPIVRGRGFDARDQGSGEPVAIVNREMVRVIWPHDDPIGACLSTNGSPCRRVIGVAANAIQRDIGEQPTMHYYVPLAQVPGVNGAALLVRTSVNHPATLMPAVRRAMQSVIPGARFSSYDGMTIQDDLDRQTRPWRMAAAMFTVLGVLALVVATLGLYSVISWQVAERTRELGIRLALGAARRHVVALVTGRIVAVVVAGLACGVLGTWAIADRLGDVLFHTSPHDPAGFIVPVVVLAVAAVVAGMVPAWRATRMDVVEAVRAE